jgi:hypothetical protein
MRIFTCQTCGRMLHFENATCLGCGSALGFLPDGLVLSVLTREGGDWRAAASGGLWRRCANAAAAECNWMVPVEAAEDFCAACRLNRTIPDLATPGNGGLWQAIEAAKRRLVYALKRFGLPLASRRADSETGLAFDFLEDAPDAPVMTGHADGLITVNIAEADAAERERRRLALNEPYRTLIGHLRHEVGHYYWDLLVRDGGRLEAARAVFGDERLDYAAAMERHYAEGPPADWQARHVSAYATMHPWEDFAETWTHYLHMVDTLDTAASFGLAVDPEVERAPGVRIAFDPYRAPGIKALLDGWVPLTLALNSLNRSMGLPDPYPFALSPVAGDKLGFIHDLIDSARPPDAT